MEKINISVENLSIEAEMFETPTAQKIIEALPLEGSVNVWGTKFILILNCTSNWSRMRERMSQWGTWHTGRQARPFVSFFGPTPVSTGDQPRAYSPVNIFGHVSGDTGQFRTVSDGAGIKITLIES